MPITAYAITVKPPVEHGYYVPVQVSFELASSPGATPNRNPAYATLNGTTPLDTTTISDATTFYFESASAVNVKCSRQGDDDAGGAWSLVPLAYASPAVVTCQPASGGVQAPELASQYVSLAPGAGLYQTGNAAVDLTSETDHTLNIRQNSTAAGALRMVQFGSGHIAKWRHNTTDVGFLNANGSLLLIPEDDAPAIYVSQPSWSAARAFAYSNKDGIFYVDNFTDASGDDSPLTYTKMFGGSMTKTGRGNVDAFWASVTHQGVEEAGLFIGDVAGTAGGNLWGGHFQLTADTVEAQMYGLQAELVNNVAHSSKQKWGIDIRSSGSQDGTIGLLIDSKPAGAAGWTNYIVGRNLAGIDVFKVTKEGCLTLTSASDGAEILRFNTDRPWTFKQSGVGGAAVLRLCPDTDTRVFEITSPNGTNKAIQITAHNTLGSHALRIMPHATGVIGFWGATPIARPTGWAAMTGTATRTAFATTTVTLEQLAQRVKALTDDLISMGLIGS